VPTECCQQHESRSWIILMVQDLGDSHVRCDCYQSSFNWIHVSRMAYEFETSVAGAYSRFWDERTMRGMLVMRDVRLDWNYCIAMVVITILRIKI
jgi:hypothetical protein